MPANLRSLFVLIVIFARMFAPAAFAASNDMFANRIVLTGTTVTVGGNNSGATQEVLEPTASNQYVASVWYTFTAPEAGRIRLTIDGAEGQLISVYHGVAVNSLTPVATIYKNNLYDGLKVQAGEELQIAIQSSNSGGPVFTGPFTMTLSFYKLEPKSSNDLFANAALIDTLPYTFTGNIGGAAREPGEPNPLLDSLPQTLWWSYKAATEGVLEMGYRAAPWSNGRLLAYRGSSLSALELVATDFNYSIEVHTQPGEEYCIQFAHPRDEFNLTANFKPRATNDTFTASERLDQPSHTVRTFFLGPTVDQGEPLVTNTVAGTLWWSWAAPADGRVVLNPIRVFLTGDSGPANIAIYAGPTIDRLTEVDARRIGLDGPYYFEAKGGSVYHIQAWARDNNDFEQTGFDLQLYQYKAAMNDNFADAASVDGVPKSTIGATRELGEPMHREGGPNKSLWWKWRPAVNRPGAAVRLGYGTLTNVTFAVYHGVSVDTLQLLAKGGDRVFFSAWACETYYIAAEIPSSDDGDIGFDLYAPLSSQSREIPGNLVKNGSFEEPSDTGWPAWNGQYGGRINEIAPDGRNFARISAGYLAQDITTRPGERYRLQFVYANEQGYETGFTVKFAGNEVAQLAVPAMGSWDWKIAEFIVAATDSVSRLELQGGGYQVNIDQVSLVPLRQPPEIVTQPENATVFQGATAHFHAGITGTLPIRRQWYFNNVAILGATNPTLKIENAKESDEGIYYLTATNDFGHVESTRVQLTVENAISPQIVLQPQSDRVQIGQYFVLQVAAVGTPPLKFQWLRDGVEMPNETNATLIFSAFAESNAGKYVVRVSNAAEGTLSLSAILAADPRSSAGGASIWFANVWGWLRENSAPVLDIDGFTRLSGSNFVAQLYAGRDEDALRPVGPPQPFLGGFSQGLWRAAQVVLPNAEPGEEVVLQTRAWDGAAGASYEAARALGGKFGRSNTLKVVPLPLTDPPLPQPGTWMAQLQSFQLRAGLQDFVTGVLTIESEAGTVPIVWKLTGAADFRYLIEGKVDNGPWQPFKVLQNQTGIVTFTDETDPNAAVRVYRARILD